MSVGVLVTSFGNFVDEMKIAQLQFCWCECHLFTTLSGSAMSSHVNKCEDCGTAQNLSLESIVRFEGSYVKHACTTIAIASFATFAFNLFNRKWCK